MVCVLAAYKITLVAKKKDLNKNISDQELSFMFLSMLLRRGSFLGALYL